MIKHLMEIKDGAKAIYDSIISKSTSILKRIKGNISYIVGR